MPTPNVAYSPLRIPNPRSSQIRRVVVGSPPGAAPRVAPSRTDAGIIADLIQRPGSLIQTSLHRQRRRYLAKEEDRGRIAATEGRTLEEIGDVSERFRIGYSAVRGIDDANKELDRLTAEVNQHANDPNYDFEEARDVALEEYFSRPEYQEASVSYKASLTERFRQRIIPLTSKALLAKKEAEQQRGLELLLSTSAQKLRHEVKNRSEFQTVFNDVYKDFVALGGDKREFDRWQTQEVIQLATDRNDPSLLDSTNIVGSDGTPLSTHSIYGKHIRSAKLMLKERATKAKATNRFQRARALFSLKQMEEEGELTQEVLEDYFEAGFLSPAGWAAKQQNFLEKQKKSILIAEQSKAAWSSGAPELEEEDQAAAYEYLIHSIPEEHRAKATAQFAALNGSLPRQKKHAMEQGLHTQSRESFEKAYNDYNVLRELAPAVAAGIKSTAENRAILFGNLLDANGGSRDMAWNLLRNSESNIQDARAAFRKDPFLRRRLKEVLKKAVSDDEDVSASWQLQQRGEDYAVSYLATGAFSPEYALEMAADQISRQSHEDEEGLRVLNSDVLPHWTDPEIREETLDTTFREHLRALNLDDNPKDYAIIPDRDGDEFIGHVVSKETGVILDSLDMEEFVRPAVGTVSQRRRRKFEAQVAAAANKAERNKVLRERERMMAEDPVTGRFHGSFQGL